MALRPSTGTLRSPFPLDDDPYAAIARVHFDGVLKGEERDVGRFQWAGPGEDDDIGGPVDARPGIHLSRRRFVSLALYTSAAVVLAGARPPGVAAASPVPAVSVGPDACMPAIPSSAPPREVIPYEALERLHLLYRNAASEGSV